MPSPADQKPFKMRLPHVDNDELIKRAAAHGQLEGWLKVMESPARYGENLSFLTVPEIYGADTAYWCVLMALILGVDPSLPRDEIMRRGVPVDQPKSPQYKRYMLMSTWLHAVHMKNGWTRTVMAGWASEGAEITRTKLLLLDMPDADIWTDDERLALKFVKAAFEWEMTDEIWDAAAEAWGAEWILAVLGMLVHYYGYSLRFQAFGLDRVVGLTADKTLAEVIGLAPPGGS